MKGQKIKELYFGGDYNPDQWDEATIRQDMEYFKKCHINYVALPVFSWAKLEPQEGVYNLNGWTRFWTFSGKIEFMYALLLLLLHSRNG